MTERFIKVGGVRLHLIDHPGGDPPIVLLPGLSATAPIFEDLIASGISPGSRSIALDLRGRGQTDAPPAGVDPASPARNYTMADHAADVLGLLTELELRQPILVGHSFGGMLAFYLAAHHGDRFARVVVLDAAAALASPATRELLRPMIDRLGVVMPSLDAYLAAVKALPYLTGAWNPAIERYYRAYVDIGPDARVRQRVDPGAVLASVDAILSEDWDGILRRIALPVLLINATEPYGPPGSQPFLTRARAMETIKALGSSRYLAVSGNHLTMVFGENARRVAAPIRGFVTDDDRPGWDGRESQGE
jgi:pimeloyl-ACP methyl ester carboxylesterase